MSRPLDPGVLNLEWAGQLLSRLVAMGLEELQIAPGSRSTPLVLAASGMSGLRTRVHLDERSAAFFALGYGRRRGVPSAVVTTSGTAVANLLPAVVEASTSDVPLLLLTADRPPSLRGKDANQTILQPGIFSSFPRLALDLPLPGGGDLENGLPGSWAGQAMEAAVGPPPGPVHLNLPFDKPLHPPADSRPPRGPGETAGGEGIAVRGPASPGAAPLSVTTDEVRPGQGPGDGSVLQAREEVTRRLAEARRPLLVAGPSRSPDLDGPRILDFGRRWAVPVLADPLSGARFDRSGAGGVVGGASFFLRVPQVLERLRPDLIIRTGRSPTSAALEHALETWSAAFQVVVDDGSLEKDHQGLADLYLRAPVAQVLDGGPEMPRSRQWSDLWRRHEEAAWQGILAGRDLPGNEGAVVAAALRATPEGASFFVSNSMPVRDLDGYGRPGDAAVRVLGNRGASGIDGIVSTILGVSAAGDEPVVGVVGDLAFLHDVNGLGASRFEGLDAVLVVIDNDGGGIFHMLPIRAFEPAFTSYFATPQGVDLRHGARLYGVAFRDAASPEEVGAAVEEGIKAGGVHVVRIRTDREVNRRCHEKTVELVEEQMREITTEESHETT